MACISRFLHQNNLSYFFKKDKKLNLLVIMNNKDETKSNTTRKKILKKNGKKFVYQNLELDLTLEESLKRKKTFN